MKTTAPAWVRSVEAWLWRHDLASESRLKKSVWHFCRVLFAVVRDVSTGQITLHAMGLVYTTLLSMVPLMALSFSVLKGLGAHNELEPLLRNLVEPLGDKGNEIVTNLLGFVDNIKVGVLGSVGLGILVYTVISLVQKIERSFNEIWRVSQSRSLTQRFSNYLSVIVIGPVLVVSAIGATATLVSSDIVQELVQIQPFGWLFSGLSRLMPYAMIIALFTFVYMFIPNTRVRFYAALTGGVTAGIAWQTAIYGFTRFVAGSNNYEAIYSGFAVGILTLIWLYLAWLILLMGAAVSFYIQHASQITRERVVEPCASADEMAGLSVMHEVLRVFELGQGSPYISEIESRLGLGPDVTERMIDRLLAANLLTLAGEEGDRLAPAKPPDKVTVAELLDVIRHPDASRQPMRSGNEAVERIMEEQRALYRSRFEGETLKDWVRGDIQQKQS